MYHVGLEKSKKGIKYFFIPERLGYWSDRERKRRSNQETRTQHNAASQNQCKQKTDRINAKRLTLCVYQDKTKPRSKNFSSHRRANREHPFPVFLPFAHPFCGPAAHQIVMLVESCKKPHGLNRCSCWRIRARRIPDLGVNSRRSSQLATPGTPEPRGRRS